MVLTGWCPALACCPGARSDGITKVGLLRGPGERAAQGWVVGGSGAAAEHSHAEQAGAEQGERHWLGHG